MSKDAKLIKIIETASAILEANENNDLTETQAAAVSRGLAAARVLTSIWEAEKTYPQETIDKLRAFANSAEALFKEEFGAKEQIH